jgi:hypothetical protein
MRFRLTFSDNLCPNTNISKEITDSIFTVPSTRQYNIPEDLNLQLVDRFAKLGRNCLYSELPSNSRVYLSSMLLGINTRHGKGRHWFVSTLLSLNSILSNVLHFISECKPKFDYPPTPFSSSTATAATQLVYIRVPTEFKYGRSHVWARDICLPHSIYIETEVLPVSNLKDTERSF